jgi:hypothetical protein
MAFVWFLSFNRRVLWETLMKSSFVTMPALIAGAVLSLFAAPAVADSQVSWSVTFGSPGYQHPPVVVHQPPVVVRTRPQFIYGAPVQVPPTIVYVPVQPHYYDQVPHRARHHRHGGKHIQRRAHRRDRSSGWHDQHRWGHR